MQPSFPPEQQFAIQFVQILTQRKFEQAYTLLTEDYQQNTSVQEIQAHFDRIIPNDWGPFDPVIAVGETLTDFPDHQLDDSGWVYVSLEGHIYPYSEGLFILVAHISEKYKIHDVVFGR